MVDIRTLGTLLTILLFSFELSPPSSSIICFLTSSLLFSFEFKYIVSVGDMHVSVAVSGEGYMELDVDIPVRSPENARELARKMLEWAESNGLPCRAYYYWHGVGRDVHLYCMVPLASPDGKRQASNTLLYLDEFLKEAVEWLKEVD